MKPELGYTIQLIFAHMAHLLPNTYFTNILKQLSGIVFLQLILWNVAQASTSVSPFVLISKKSPKLDKYLKSYQLLKIDREITKDLYQKNQEEISIEFPITGKKSNFQLQSREVHASGFQVLNAAGKDVTSSLQLPQHFRLPASKTNKDLLAFSIFSDGNVMMVYSDRRNNWNLVALPESLMDAGADYVLFSDADIRFANPFLCKSEELRQGQIQEKKIGQPPSVQEDTSCKLTEIYWECDHDMFVKGGNSIQGALNSFEAMFNGTAILFENEVINIGIKAVKVWDTPDPYSYASSFTALDDFMDAGNAANWPGQLAHLLSTRPLNLGGVAYLNALCTNFRYGFSNIDFTFAPLPFYSWTISTIAHELGHNFSSPHTHNCNWEISPGVFGQIDSCWNAEGDCQPTIRGRIGTIMSYCHLTGSVNLSLGFGPLPGDRIRNGFANMSCVSGTIVVPPFTPTNSGPFCDGNTLNLSAENLTGFSYTWSGPNGFSANSREVAITNVTQADAGFYSLSVKKGNCQSRFKKTEAIFNCMQIGLTPPQFCAGGRVAVPFISTGTFQAGNQFILQLSNSVGQFTNPYNLDTITTSIPQTIDAFLPNNLPLGNGYRFRLISTQPAYIGLPAERAIIINPVGPSPTPVDGNRCGEGTVDLTALGGTSLHWYPSPSELLPTAVGRWFTTPVLNQSRSYYVQSGSLSKNTTGLSRQEGTFFDSLENGLIFDALSGFRLDSLWVRVKKNPSGITNGQFTIVLQNSIGQVYSKSISVSVSPSESGWIKIPLYWRIDPGSAYALLCKDATVKLQMGTGNFPYKVISLVNIIGNYSGGAPWYPYFYEWVIQRYNSCPSRRVEVKAKIINGTPPPTPQIILSGGDSLSCSVSAPLIQWLIADQTYSGLGQKVKGLLNLTYQVRYKLDSCWSEWSEPLLFSVTENLGLIENEMQLFPNPAKGLVRMQWKEMPENVEVWDMKGRRLLELKPESNHVLVNISGFSGGIYFLKWHGRNRSGIQKLLKEE